MNLEKLNSAVEAEKKNISLLDHSLSTCRVRLEIFKTTMAGMVGSGVNTRKIADKIDLENVSMVEIEKKINESRAKLSAYEDLLKILPNQENFKLREGTEIASIEKFIRFSGGEVSLDDIVKHVAKAGDDIIKKKKSLRGTLRAYVRDDKVFCDGQEPDTYSLIEFRRLEGKSAGT